MEQIKIFQTFGHSGISRMEAEINKWMEATYFNKIKIEDIKIAQSGGGLPNDEIAQSLTVLIVYRQE